VGGNEQQQIEDLDFMPDYITMPLADGREVHVTSHEPTWHHLASRGLIVFSANEMERLQVSLAGMGKEDAAMAALVAVDIKETWATAYVRSGRAGGEVAHG
jgi:hypothetical protein